MIDLDRPLGIKDNPIVSIPLHELRELQALAADRLKLLKRIVDGGLVDPIAHEPGECEDCDLMREVMKEVGR